MTLLVDMIALTSRLIPKFGFTSVIRRKTGGSIDPVTGANSETTSDLAVSAIAMEIDIKRIDNTTILAGDRMYVLTSAVEPQSGDRFKVGSEYWQIVTWQNKQVQAGDVAYVIQVRK